MGQGSETWTDETGAVIINETAVGTNAVMAELAEQQPEVAALVRWGQQTQRRQGGLFERDRFITPGNIYDQMRTAYDAAEHDDIVGGILDTTEALAFGKLDLETDDEDEEDIWNQIAADLDLDARLREMWRELFTVSQFYAVTWWGTKSYQVRGKTKGGVKRKKQFAKLRVPTAITLLDPLKIVPVGNFLFNKERLAYIATNDEAESFDRVLAGHNTTDLVVRELIEEKYNPTETERKTLSDLEIDPLKLYLLNEKRVWRHTATRAQYERFAKLRMKSVFELLDLKQQLRQMDRAHLIGGTNFIVLVKKGTDDLPAKPAEISSLAAQVKAAARVPVIVGDHRLEVEIITPKTDTTMRPERYNTLDSRIEARLFQMFMTGNYAAGAKGDDSIKLAKVVGRGLEGRRHMLRRSLELHVLKPTVERNEQFTAPCKLRFHPKRVALDFDPALATFLLDLRDRGDISRESILDEVDFSQADESRKRKMEAEKYDDVFQTQVPFSSPNASGAPGAKPNKPGAGADPRTGGRRAGGLRNGGGLNPDSKTPNSNPARPRRGNNSKNRLAANLEDEE
jgi:hypothetical protein